MNDPSIEWPQENRGKVTRMLRAVPLLFEGRRISWWCQTAFDSALGGLHLLQRDILGLLRHVGLILSDARAVAHRHADSDLQRTGHVSTENV